MYHQLSKAQSFMTSIPIYLWCMVILFVPDPPIPHWFQVSALFAIAWHFGAVYYYYCKRRS